MTENASRRIVLHFPSRLVGEPVISHLVKRCDLDFNILKASVTPREEGLMVLEITGSEDSCDSGLAYLAERGVAVQPLSEDVVRNERRCTHCGLCTQVCPSGVLVVDRRSMEVLFDSAKCVGCQMCVPACPTRAMEVRF